MLRWYPFRDLKQMDETMNQLWYGFGGVPSGISQLYPQEASYTS